MCIGMCRRYVCVDFAGSLLLGGDLGILEW